MIVAILFIGLLSLALVKMERDTWKDYLYAAILSVVACIVILLI